MKMIKEKETLDKTVMYHYCNKGVWKAVNDGHRNHILKDPKTGEHFDGKDFKGLWPNWRLIETGPGSELVPTEATKPAIFGFLDETPHSWIDAPDWTRYADGRSVFDYLMSCCADEGNNDDEAGLILLKVDLLAEDNPLIVDYAHVREMAKDFNAELDSETKRRIKAEGMKMYWESRIPLANYDGSFTLPEVVIWNPVPKERVHFVWEKNLYQFLDEVHSR